MISTASISECERYRTELGRYWDATLPILVFGMLNPSRADAKVNDQTVGKCVGFAERNGFGAINVWNLYPFRATDPRDLHKWIANLDAAGVEAIRENDCAIRRMVAGQTVVYAWGAHGRKMGHAVRRADEIVRPLAARICVLATLADGTPGHPLMLPYSSRLTDTRTLFNVPPVL